MKPAKLAAYYMEFLREMGVQLDIEIANKGDAVDWEERKAFRGFCRYICSALRRAGSLPEK